MHQHHQVSYTQCQTTRTAAMVGSTAEHGIPVNHMPQHCIGCSALHTGKSLKSLSETPGTCATPKGCRCNTAARCAVMKTPHPLYAMWAYRVQPNHNPVHLAQLDLHTNIAPATPAASMVAAGSRATAPGRASDSTKLGIAAASFDTDTT